MGSVIVHNGVERCAASGGKCNTCAFTFVAKPITQRAMANHKNTNEPGKQNRTFRLDSDTMRRVERLAEAENRTVNNMVETILKQTVQGKKELAR